MELLSKGFYAVRIYNN